MLKLRVSQPLLLLLVVLLAGLQSARAFPIGRMRHLKPTVEVAPDFAGPWLLANEKTSLRYGQWIRCRNGGKADLLFNNGTELVLHNASVQLVRPANTEDPMVIRLVGALSEIFIKARKKTVVRTAGGVAGSHGTDYSVFLPTDDSVRVTVMEGLVDLSNPLGSVTIAANQQSQASTTQAPSPPVAVDASGLIGWTAQVAGLPLTARLPYSSTPRKALLARRKQLEIAGPNRNGEAWGEVAYDLGDYQEAATAFEGALAAAPNNQELRGKLGLAQLAGGDVPAALATLTPAQANARARAALALAQAAAGNSPAALATLNGVQDPWGLTVMGQLQLTGGQAGNAIATLRQALAAAGDAAPEQAEARALLALALLENNQIAAASQTAELAIKQAPGLSLTQAVGSMTAFFAGDNNRALSRSKAALAEDPFAPLALVAYSRAKAREGDLDEARQAAAQAATLASDAPRLQLEVADLNLLLDQPKAAETGYRRVLVLQPGSVAAHSGLGAALDAQGKRTEALQEHQAAMQLDPKNSLARGRLAAHYLELGDLPAAQQLVGQGLDDTPEDGQLYIRLSELLLYQQDLIGAQEAARHAVRLLPGSAPALYQLGRVYLEQGRTVQAQIAFRQALVLRPNHNAARYALGLTRDLLESPVTGMPSLSSGAIRLTSPSTTADIQNLAAPGASDRIQAAVTDPTVVRTATRSVGDLEFDGALGSSQLGVSYLSELKDRNAFVGANADQLQNNEILPDISIRLKTVGLSYGEKTDDRSQAFFLDGRYKVQHTRKPWFAPGAIQDSHEPAYLGGYSWHQGTRGLTRLIVQQQLFEGVWNQPDNGAQFNEAVNSTDLQFRQDIRLNQTHQLSIGGSYGGARVDTRFSGVFFGTAVDSTSRRLIRPWQVYVRDQWQASPCLSLTTELRAVRQRHSLESADFGTFPFAQVDTPNPTTHTDPKVILGVKLSDYTTMRLRARSFRPVPTQMNLLEPADDFFISLDDLPRSANFDSLFNHWPKITEYDLEWDHTNRNAAVWRATLFHQVSHVTTGMDLSPTLLFERVRTFGLRAAHERALSPNCNGYLHLNWTHSRATPVGFDAMFNPIILPETQTENVPNYAVEIGIQYLNRKGWLAQGSFYYQSGFVRPTGEQAGGFAVTGLRLGKRSGLKRVVFVEVNNLFDKQFDFFGAQQLGRKFHAGFSQRF